MNAYADSYASSGIEPNLSNNRYSENKTKRADEWNGIDKLKHYSVSLILTTSSYYYMKKPIGYSNNRSLSISIPFSFLVGLGKEIRDSKEIGNHFSMKDLAVDIMGVASGWIIANNLR